MYKYLLIGFGLCYVLFYIFIILQKIIFLCFKLGKVSNNYKSIKEWDWDENSVIPGGPGNLIERWDEISMSYILKGYYK